MSNLLTLLDKAVQKHLFDEDFYRVGVNVSGGLDSSTVVCLAKRWQPDIQTYTGFYNVPGFDERRYSRMATAGTIQHEIEITPRHFVDNFDAMISSYTPPFQGPGMFGQYMVAKRIAQGASITTLLSGEGADELFGGYARLMKVAGHPMPDGYDNYTPPADYPTDVKAALDYDYERLPDLLKVDDEALGAFGLKAAAPFTDERVVAHALGLPVGMRVGKVYLRHCVRGIVPDPIIDRTDKKGFPVPLVLWANEHGNPVRDFVGDRLGYIPDPSKPFDRGWWLELCERTVGVPLAA